MKFIDKYDIFTENKKIDEGFKDIITGIMLLGTTLLPTASKADGGLTNTERDFIKNNPSVVSDIETAIDKMKSDPTYYQNFLKDAERMGVKGIELKQALKLAKYDLDNAKKNARFSKTTTSSFEEAIKLMKKGYILTDYGKQIIKKIKNIEPDPLPIDSISFEIDANDFFGSGDYEISDNALNDLRKSVEELTSSIAQQDSVIISITIESSTDNQRVSSDLGTDLEDKGYSGDNEGLSKVRNDKSKDALIKVFKEKGLDYCLDIIQVTNSETGEDGGNRYMKIKVNVLSFPAAETQEPITIEEDVEQVSITLINIYKKYKPKKKINSPSFRIGSKSYTPKVHKTNLKAVKCSF